jgi:hypothetical protein
MPLPKLPEQRELERIEASIQGRINEKERELQALRETLEAVQEATALTAEASRKYYGKQPL